METTWLDALRVGDKVLVYVGGGRRNIRCITRITPSQILIDTTRYNKKTGREITKYTRHNVLEPYDPEVVAQMELERLQSWLLHHCRNVQRSAVQSLTKAQCEGLLNYLKELKLVKETS